MLIRPAGPDDADEIGAYHHRAWLEVYADHLGPDAPEHLDEDGRIEQWDQWLRTQEWARTESGHLMARASAEAMVTMVVDIDGVVVGHASVGPAHEPETGELISLYVDPDRQGEGHGRRLLGAAERALRLAEFDEAILWTIETNTAAIAFYERAGWVLDGGTKPSDPWGFPVPVVRLRRSLGEVDQLDRNQHYWDTKSPDQPDSVMTAWEREPAWGIIRAPEAELKLLGDLTGLDVVELGCGVGYVSAWCRRLGARSVVGIDLSPVQLATAQRFQGEHELDFPLVRADCEAPPFADGSFDLAVSEYGAAIWCDPRRWLGEASRLLRPGGRLIFLGNSVGIVLCSPDFEENGPATPALLRPQRDMHRFEFPDTDNVEFHVSHGEMIRLLRAADFEVLDLVELYAEPEDETPYSFLQGEWASQWPAEEIWVARKR